ncbi:MAG: hypothetical protein KTR22_12430 [Flavobacteriaceae bacterium]|nr:hypothetical protein [Flavobacteriaceae bacterium]
MKTNNLILFLAVFVTSVVSAQYNCSRFYPFEEGVVCNYQFYDELGNLAGGVVYSIDSVEEVAGVQYATMGHSLRDNNGNHLMGSKYKLSCEGGTLAIDFNSFVRPDMLSRLGSDYDITGTNLTIPNDLTVGDALPNADLNINATMGGTAVNFTISFNNRTVISEESITTEAGTFDCYVIAFTMEMNMGYPYTISSRMWLSEGVGMVQQEDFDEDGNLMNRIVLHSFTN